MTKRLFIDLYKCDGCDTCRVKCAYLYRPNATDHGILKIRELATFLVMCRRCEDPSCAKSCRFQALERQPTGIMKRYNMRCVSCKCCCHGCPFGVIYEETVPFYDTHCDFCLALEGKEPPCTVSCERGAIEFKEVEESPKDEIYVLSDRLAVRAPRWDKKNV